MHGPHRIVGLVFVLAGATALSADGQQPAARPPRASESSSKTASPWKQAAYVKASNPREGAQFGFAVALSADGSTLAVGSQMEESSATGINGKQDDHSKFGAGAVYVYARGGAGWSQQAYIKASNTDQDDQFGFNVALSADGNTLAVSAPYEDSAATGINGNQADNSMPNAGAVYVFTRSGTAWSQQAYIKASNTGDAEEGDQFGYSISLSGDGNLLVAGAIGEDSGATTVNGDEKDNSAPNAGAAYVFVRNGTTWTEQANFTASNVGKDDWFGIHLHLSGDGNTFAVSAPNEDGASQGINGKQDAKGADEAGAVYLFNRQGTTWSQQVYFKGSNTKKFDEFGSAVAVSRDGRTMAVGAHFESSGAKGVNGNQQGTSMSQAGAVYVFVR